MLARACKSSGGERFIYQQGPWAHRTGDRDALAHTPGELVGALVEGFGERQPPQRLTRGLLALDQGHGLTGRTTRSARR